MYHNAPDQQCHRVQPTKQERKWYEAAIISNKVCICNPNQAKKIEYFKQLKQLYDGVCQRKQQLKCCILLTEQENESPAR